MKYAGHIVLVVMVCLAFVALVGWYHFRSSEGGFICTDRIEYGKMPKGDSALVDWLEEQPGVTDVSVTREGKALVVTYQLQGGHLPPKVLDKANNLGYRERGSFSGNMRSK